MKNYVNQKKNAKQAEVTPEEFIDLFGEFCDTLSTLEDYATRLYYRMADGEIECPFCMQIEECDDGEDDAEDATGIQVDVSEDEADISSDDEASHAGVNALLIDPQAGCFPMPLRAALEFLGGFGDNMELTHLDQTYTLGFDKSTVAECGDEKYVTGPLIAMKNRTEIQNIGDEDMKKLFKIMTNARSEQIRKGGKNIPGIRLD